MDQIDGHNENSNLTIQLVNNRQKGGLIMQDDKISSTVGD
jgi:hypothetical protein